jgi:acyl-CoA synthetase (AMP-forming)/AMP-acid ligase II
LYPAFGEGIVVGHTCTDIPKISPSGLTQCAIGGWSMYYMYRSHRLATDIRISILKDCQRKIAFLCSWEKPSKAFVVVVDGATPTDKQALANCRAHLEDYMVPKHVEFRTELPKTSLGKMTKTGLS